MKRDLIKYASNHCVFKIKENTKQIGSYSNINRRKITYKRYFNRHNATYKR